MTLVLHRNVVGEDMRPAAKLAPELRRLSAVVAQHAPKTRPFIVSLHHHDDTMRPCDDTVRTRDQWAQTLVSKQHVVVITYLPLGGGGGGGQSSTKQVGTAVALLALTAAAPYLGAGFAGGLGLTGGGLAAIGKLTAAGILTRGNWGEAKCRL